MLIVTANWALADGSLAPSRGRRAVAWMEMIRRAIARAGVGRDGRYRPVTEATIVMAGDTFDWLLSDVWTGRDRPWHTGRRSAEARARVAAATVGAAVTAARIVRRWIRQGVPLPAADARGRPSAWAGSRGRVHAVLLAGDRDPWLTDLAAAADRLGVLVGEEWSDGVHHVRHGHDLDPLAHGPGLATGSSDRPPTLAESLAIDLVVTFAAAARDDAPLWQLVRPRLAEVASAGPSHLPACLNALVPDAHPAASVGSLRTRLGNLWRRCVDRWYAIAQRDTPSCEAEFDALGELAAWLANLDATRAPPASLRRLATPVAAVHSPNRSVLGHVAAGHVPTCSCHLADLSWEEHLEPTRAGSPVVAVGVKEAGRDLVDAA